MDKDQARLAAENFASGNITDAEHEAFFQWLLSLPLAESRALIEEYSGIFEALPPLPARKELWGRIYQKLDEPVRKERGRNEPLGKAWEQEEPLQKEREEALAGGRLVMFPRSHKNRSDRQKWTMAAAAVLLFLTAGIFLLVAKRPIPSTAERPVQDIAPGGNKALLTLADGTTIVLDSALDGQLASQGSTRVLKPKNGQLVYDASRPAASGPTSVGSTASGLSTPGSPSASPASAGPTASRPSPANDQSPVTYNTISTPKGGQYRVILPDGTNVLLNSASTLKYPTAFTQSVRLVRLTGEAYFEVAHVKAMPFRVDVSGMQVNVLGTHFDIMAYADETTVNTTLAEGSVQVVRGNEVKMIKPGEQTVLDKSSQRLTVQVADVDKTLAWTTGFFKFHNTDLSAIMREISRWYDIDVVYGITDKGGKYGGTISRNLNLSLLIRLLEENGIHHYRMEGKKLIVLP